MTVELVAGKVNLDVSVTFSHTVQYFTFEHMQLLQTHLYLLRESLIDSSVNAFSSSSF